LIRLFTVFLLYIFFTCKPPATTEIYTLSLHDALPISSPVPNGSEQAKQSGIFGRGFNFLSLGFVQFLICGLIFELYRLSEQTGRDRKSTRLNSSHVAISYAVFCLKKKKAA